MSERALSAEVVVAGAGLAGLTTAYECLDSGRSVLLIDKDTEGNLGGLARESFGGVHLIGTPHQRRLGIRDTPELALADWLGCAEFGPDDHLPRAWAEFYCRNSDEYIFRFLEARKVEFLPVVNWPERGVFKAGNSVPRWHITWGTGHELAVRVLDGVREHRHRQKLTVLTEHEVSDIVIEGGRAVGVRGRAMRDGRAFTARAEHVVIASGGICGGDLSRLRAHWFRPWGDPPTVILNGAHRYGDGMLHDRVAAHGGVVTHLDKQWNYAAGIHHPRRSRPHDGLSLVPPRSALWLNALGQRIENPEPIVSYTDTRHLVESICRQPGKYSWQLMNWKIAIKELAVSGSDYMTAFRNKSKPQLVKHLLFGNRELVERLIRECPEDVVVAGSLDELVGKMNERNLDGLRTDPATVASTVAAWDGMIERGPAFHNDHQLRWIADFRRYRGDRIRTCKFQKILDPGAMPLIAIREFILARKSLGGIQTDLGSRVLRGDGRPIPGLYAVGEAAGFGGGGIHGRGSLEGGFLGSCVLTGRVAGQTIAGA